MRRCSLFFPNKTLYMYTVPVLYWFITLVKSVSLFFFSLLAEFYPIFQIIDLVTEEHTVYKEPYSLRAIAGGTGPTNMQYFNQSM